MNALRRAGTPLLSLVLAGTACSAPTPSATPVDDTDDAPAAMAPAAGAAGASETAAQTPPVEATAPDKAVIEPLAQATAPAGPEQASPPEEARAPAETTPPPSKPRPATNEKAPLRPTPVGASPVEASPPVDADKADAAPVHLTINALSRGKGVPAETRDAFKQVRALLERQQATPAVAALRYQRMGIEGETRLCVEFRNADDAKAAQAEIRRISAGVDLLEVVEQPCPSSKEYKP